MPRFSQMRSTLRSINGPIVEPLTVDELRMWLRRDDTFEDSKLADLIKAARETIENRRHCALLTQTWELRMDGFPCDDIQLRRGPVTAVASIEYTDTAGDQQTVDAASYKVGTASFPGIIRPAFGQAWPAVLGDLDSVVITFTVGYATSPSNVPESARVAIRELAGEWFENAENAIQGQAYQELPNGFDRLIQFVGWEGYR